MMNIEFNQQDIQTLKQLGVAGVVLFGSQAQGTAGIHSDVDMGVLLQNPQILGDGDRKTNLYEKLYDIFSARVGQLVNIDIVFLHGAPMDLQTHVMKHGKVLYEDRPSVFANFKERVMEESADFEPYRRMFQNAVMARIHP